MQLRRLEAYGFKSFAEKTEIEFKPGITAIVGPNGSGKSNISDAVRWVLGEQNIRNLRGAKMEDVIFAGSAKRRALGIAEVSLVFDNSDGLLPLDFSEVTITRRVFRSGDGEYYINKSACRLKDIHDLLTEAGLGRESMTVISQNKIDEVLNSKADERRLLFEEAAGIIKYKNRKRDAMRKLDDTEQNLTRVFDITSEIETQLDPLAESAERTARFNSLSKELTSCQVTMLLDRLTRAEKNQESVVLEQATLNDNEIETSTKLTLGETEKERITSKLAELDETVRTVETQVSGTITEIERVDGKAAVLAERIEQEQRNRGRLAQDIERITSEREESRTNLASRQETLAGKRQEVQELAGVLETQQAQFSEISEAIAAAEQKIEEAKDQTFGHLQELVTQRNSQRTLERDLETQKSREVTLTEERDQFQLQLTESKKLLADNQAEKTSFENDMRQTDTRIASLTEQKKSLEQTLNEQMIAEGQLTTQINEMASRMKILANMQEEYEGFGRGAKSVLKSGAPWRKEVGGAVAQLLSVPDKYVTAVEIALGGALQHIVVDSDSAAKAAIEFLKSNNLGRATFLPLNTIKINRPRDSETAAAHAQGALGFASDLVQCEQRFRPVMEFLLGRTIVAQTIDAALKIAKQQGFGVRIVTLDGELINPGGSIAGGSTGKREASFISRGNEIESLKQAMVEHDAKRKTLRQRAEDSKADVADLQERLSSATAQRRSLEVRLAELTVHLENTQLEVKRIGLGLATLDSELAACRKDGERIVVKIAEISGLVVTLEERDSDHKLYLTARQEELKQLQDKREENNATLTDTKIRLSALQQEVSAMATSCEEYEQSDRRLAKQLETLQADQGRVDSEITRANTELADVVTIKDTLFARKTEQEQLRSSHLTEKLGVLARQQKLDREVRDLRRKLNGIQSRQHELELLAAKFGYEITYCTEQLRDHHTITREEAQALYREEDPEVLEARVQELEDEILALGPVNPAAIDEYTRLKERYEFLRTQYNDLKEAKDYLLTIIKDIDATMSKQFRAAFQEINTHFGDLFVRLFGGGKAQIELTDPDDILASGIEIVVQPPGKKQQNLALLSGGERALTVIALLFSFLTYRPTPFCVLDEIDAALDESNVNRFSEFLRDYAQHTQFIIVTHRKGTMEVADVMHGVTMEESGVSKMISVKFMDEAG
ncbi:MAG: chromosome segregation protein SMC [Negativicutes bacterium]|nr:chromosome segregation protein SMC [Negativicutes bacterium]